MAAGTILAYPLGMQILLRCNQRDEHNLGKGGAFRGI